MREKKRYLSLLGVLKFKDPNLGDVREPKSRLRVHAFPCLNLLERYSSMRVLWSGHVANVPRPVVRPLATIQATADRRQVPRKYRKICIDLDVLHHTL